MPLPLIVDSIDSVPEPLRANYVQHEGGKYRLDLEGYEDPANLKSALQKEREAAKAAAKQAKAWADLGKTPEEISALLAKQAQEEEAALKGAGQWDKLKAQMLDQHKAEISKRDEALTKSRARLERHLVDAQAVAAISAHKGVPTLLLPHVKAAVKVVEDGDELVVRVVDAAGNPRVNAKGEFLSIADLVGEMRQDAIFGRAFEPSGATGGGSRESTGGDLHKGKTVTRAQWDGMDHVARSKFSKDGGKVVD